MSEKRERERTKAAQPVQRSTEETRRGDEAKETSEEGKESRKRKSAEGFASCVRPCVWSMGDASWFRPSDRNITQRDEVYLGLVVIVLFLSGKRKVWLQKTKQERICFRTGLIRSPSDL